MNPPRPHHHSAPTVTLNPFEVAIYNTGPLFYLWLYLWQPNHYRVVLAPELATKCTGNSRHTFRST